MGACASTCGKMKGTIHRHMTNGKLIVRSATQGFESCVLEIYAHFPLARASSKTSFSETDFRGLRGGEERTSVQRPGRVFLYFPYATWSSEIICSSDGPGAIVSQSVSQRKFANEELLTYMDAIKSTTIHVCNVHVSN